ncbi:MAG: divalent-cation tolerance protein CutA [Nitrospinaceae bacterium]|nr:MAG: divalent-cation tolerance protein CutA [Nitrospinaceae bacterium]
MEQHIVIFVTAGSAEEAGKLSRGLVEAKLAFCVNALPRIKSTYYWEDKLCVDEEILLIIKTRSEKFEALEAWVRKNHSYSVPEVIAIPIIKGSEPYLKSIDDWVS